MTAGLTLRSSWLRDLAQALGLFALSGLSLGFGASATSAIPSLERYVQENYLEPRARAVVLGSMLGAAAIAMLLALGAALLRGGTAGSIDKFLGAARRLSPLCLLGPVPLLFRWRAWQGREIEFLVFVAAFSFAGWASVRTALLAPPFAWEQRLRARFGPRLARFGHVAKRLPLAIVVCGIVAYVAYFAHYTLAFHYSARSGYDLALENNLMWNLVHGGPLFKSSPLVGPTGSHFGYHATLFAFVMAPIYALAPRAETLLVIQATLLGAAALPLFLFGRRVAGAWTACAVALAYLMYPALHGANLYEFHYLPLGPFFLFWALYLLDTGRYWLAAILVVITLSVREDVAAWVAVLGCLLLVTGRRPRAGVVLALVGAAYFCTMKFFVMPKFANDGGESFTFLFQGLIPAGEKGFGSVLSTAVGNPGFLAGTLLTRGKLLYVLQLLVPLAFIPFRKPLWLLLVVPGFFFTLLTTDYWPTISITYQYGAHWIAFLFPGTLLCLGAEDARASRTSFFHLPAVVALALGSIPCSYQFGAILQRNTAMGGPIKYLFGVDDEGKQRHDSIAEIARMLPRRAKVSCSGFVTPQLSSRPDAYSMTLGLYDAEYIAFPSEPSHFIVNEKDTVKTLLKDGTFGVVAVRPPFALARRGHPTDKNADLLARLP
jgi:uncharacterized membrane protein